MRPKGLSFLGDIRNGRKGLQNRNSSPKEQKVQTPDDRSLVQKLAGVLGNAKNVSESRKADSDFPTQTKTFYHTYLLTKPPPKPEYYLQYKFRPSNERFQIFVQHFSAELKLQKRPRVSLKDNSLILWSGEQGSLENLKKNFIVQKINKHSTAEHLRVDTSTLYIEGTLPSEDLEKLFVDFINFKTTGPWHPPTRITPEEQKLYKNREGGLWPYVRRGLRGFFTERNGKQALSINEEEEKKLFEGHHFKKQTLENIKKWLSNIYGEVSLDYVKELAKWDFTKQKTFQQYFDLDGSEYWYWKEFKKVTDLSEKLCPFCLDGQKETKIQTKLKQHVCSQDEGNVMPKIVQIQDPKFKKCLYVSLQQKLEECKAGNVGTKDQWFGLEFVPCETEKVSSYWDAISGYLKEAYETIEERTYKTQDPLVNYCLKQPYFFEIMNTALKNNGQTFKTIKKFFKNFIDKWINTEASQQCAQQTFETTPFDDPSVQSWLVMDIWRFLTFFDGKNLKKVKNNVFFPLRKVKLPSAEYQLTDEKLAKNISSWVDNLNKSAKIDLDEIIFVSKFLKYGDAASKEGGIQLYARNPEVPFVPISYLSTTDYNTLKKELAENLQKAKKKKSRPEQSVQNFSAQQLNIKKNDSSTGSDYIVHEGINPELQKIQRLAKMHADDYDSDDNQISDWD